MKTRLRMISVVTLLVGMGIATVAAAQTPLPNTAPKLTMRWLNTLTFSPSTVPAGTEVIGTVTLLRPAISNLPVSLHLSGASPYEGNIWVADGALLYSVLTVSAGSDRATFRIGTSKPTSTTGSKTFTVTASYGAERVSANFTTNQLGRPRHP